MKKMPLRSTLSLLATAALLGACGSTTSLKEPTTMAPVESRSTAADGAGAAGSGATTAGTPQSGVTTVDLAGSGGTAAANAAALAALASQRVVYFDFDSFAVRSEFQPMMEGHAKLLSSNKARKVVIEGHTDERGGREYNLALGQKRAEAVARTLEVLGASGAQIEAVSFGKERPAMQGSDETAYARNRRAELKDR